MNITDDLKEKIIALGKLNYPCEKCMNVLELNKSDRKEFEKDFNDKNSDVAQIYQNGIDLADFEIDTKLYQLAKSGDMKAIQMYDRRKLKYD